MFSHSLLTAFYKWTFGPPMHGGASRRHVFEINTNRFALIPQLHGAKPFDNLGQETSIRQRYASGVDPGDDLGDGFHPRSAALQEESQATVQTHLTRQGTT